MTLSTAPAHTRERRVVPLHTTRAYFFLQRYNQCIPLHQVRETSISGLTLHLNKPLEAGSLWTLSCDTADWSLTVKATIKDCLEAPRSDDEEQRYKIELCYQLSDSEALQEAGLFHMALREYLDDFL